MDEHATGARAVEDFQDYWDRACRDKLEINQATVIILQMWIPKPRFVLPTPIWDRCSPLIAGQRWPAHLTRPREGNALDTGTRCCCECSRVV